MLLNFFELVFLIFLVMRSLLQIFLIHHFFQAKANMTDQEEKLEKGKLEPPRLPARDTFQSTPNIFEKINKRENIYHNIYGDTNTRWTGILTLLCRWKQSVYSLIWNDVVIFLVIYFFLSLLYRFVLAHYPTHKQTFEILCIYAESFTSSMPITFLLGFYVSQVVSRWWDQFMTLPYPDLLALKLVAFIPGRVSLDYRK